MAKITYSDLFGTDILKSLKAELKEVDALIKGLPKIDLKLKGDGNELKTHTKNVETLQLIEGKLETQRVKFTSLEKQRQKALLADAQKLAKERKRNADALDRQRQKALQTIRKEEIAEEKLQNAINKTIKSQKDLREQTNALVKVRDRLDNTTEKGINEWNKLTAQIKRNTQSLIKNDESIERHQRKVGKYENAFKKVGAGFASIGGALGITAGVALLTDGFQMLSEKATVLVKSQKEIAFLFGVTGNEARDLTADINALATAFDVDSKDIQKSVNAVSKEFGIDAVEALALVEEGFRKGSNTNGNFLELLEEYPTQFKAAGIGAKETFAIINAQVKEGTYSDKGVSAIKEAGLRLRENTKAVQDALKPLDDSVKKQIEQEIAAGNSFKAIQLVSGALKDSSLTAEQTQKVIADVFGGDGEDAGLRYIKTLSSVNLNLNDVKNQTSSVQDATLDFNKSFNKLILDTAQGTSGFGKFIAELISLGTAVSDSLLKGNALTDVFKSIGEEFSGLFGVISKITSLFGGLADKASVVDVIFKVLSVSFTVATAPLRLTIFLITGAIEGFVGLVKVAIKVKDAINNFALSFDFVNNAVQLASKGFGIFTDAINDLLITLGILDKEQKKSTKTAEELAKENDIAAYFTKKRAEEEAKAVQITADKTEADRIAKEEQEKLNKAIADGIEATKKYNTALKGLRQTNKATYEGLVTDVFEKNEINRANELQALENSFSDLSASQIKKIKQTEEYLIRLDNIQQKYNTEEQNLRDKARKEEEAKANAENQKRIKQKESDFKALQAVSAEQFRASVIDLKANGATEEEIAIKTKEFKILQLQNYLDFAMKNQTDLTEAQKRGLQNTINELGIELDEFKKGTDEGEGLSSIIAKKLGLTEDGLNDIVSAGAELVSELGSVIDENLAKESEALDEKKSLSDERIELLNDELENFEETKSKEAELLESELESEQERIDKLKELGVAYNEDKLVELQTELANQNAIDAEKDVIKQAQTAKDLADEKAKNAEIEKEQKRVAEKQKRLALARSVISTAIAVGNALATPPLPVGLALAVLAGAKGAIEYRKIQAQEFAEGTESVQRKGAPKGVDTIPAMVNENERIMTAEQNSQMPNGVKNKDIPHLVKQALSIPKKFRNMRKSESAMFYLNQQPQRISTNSRDYTDHFKELVKNTRNQNKTQTFDSKGRLISEKIGNITNRYR